MGGLFEEVVEANGTVKQRSHVGDFLIDERSGPVEAPTISRRYLIRDNLGSVSVILDDHLADGLVSSILSSPSYEAFGAEATSTRFNAGADVANMTRGYTDHEQFDDLGIIHMNGRIYDAGLGRFLSADPLVSHPYFSQSYNRYSYVMNNPLSATDPSGFEVQYIPVPVFLGGDDDSCFDGRPPSDGPTVRGCIDGCNTQSGRSFTGYRTFNVTEDRVAYRSDSNSSYLRKMWAEGQSTVLEGIKPGTPPPMLKAPAAVAPDAVAGGGVDDELNFTLAYVVERPNENSDYGHAFVGGIRSDGTTEAWGFYPKKPDGWALIDQGTYRLGGVVNDDKDRFDRALSGDDNFAMLTFKVNEATYRKAMNHIQRYDKGNDYGLITNSCVHATINTFQKADIIHYESPAITPRPSALYDAFKSNQTWSSSP